MRLKRSVLDASPETLIDAMMDGYVAWREACAAVEKAYRDWLSARRDDEAAAFVAYSTALDREEYVAGQYRRLIPSLAMEDD